MFIYKSVKGGCSPPSKRPSEDESSGIERTPQKTMRLVLFRTKGAIAKAPLRVGAMHPSGGVVDISAAALDSGLAPLSSMRVFLEMGPAGTALAKSTLANPAYLRSMEHIELRAPIYDRCVGCAQCPSSRLSSRLSSHPHPPHPTPHPAARRSSAWA